MRSARRYLSTFFLTLLLFIAVSLIEGAPDAFAQNVFSCASFTLAVKKNTLATHKDEVQLSRTQNAIHGQETSFDRREKSYNDRVIAFDTLTIKFGAQLSDILEASFDGSLSDPFIVAAIENSGVLPDELVEPYLDGLYGPEASDLYEDTLTIKELQKLAHMRATTKARANKVAKKIYQMSIKQIVFAREKEIKETKWLSQIGALRLKANTVQNHLALLKNRQPQLEDALSQCMANRPQR